MFCIGQSGLCVHALGRRACVKACVNTRVQERENLIDCSGNNNSNKIQQ